MMMNNSENTQSMTTGLYAKHYGILQAIAERLRSGYGAADPLMSTCCWRTPAGPWSRMRSAGTGFTLCRLS